MSDRDSPPRAPRPEVRLPNLLIGILVGALFADLMNAVLNQRLYLAELALVVPAAIYDSAFTSILLTPLAHSLGASSWPLQLIADIAIVLLIGRAVEELFGRAFGVIAYYLTAVVGSAVCAAVAPADAFYGSSAGVLGLVGLSIGVIVVREAAGAPPVFEGRRMVFLGIAVIVLLAAGEFDPYVNNIAHLGGLLAGLLLSFVLVPRLPVRPAGALAVLTGAGIVAALVGSLWAVRFTPSATLTAAVLRSQKLYDAGDLRGGAALLEQALSVDPAGSADVAFRPMAQNQLAWFYVELDEHLDYGLTLSIESNRARPKTPALLDTLGYLYAMTGDCEKAAETMQEATTLDAGYGARRDEVKRACEQSLRPDPKIPVEKPQPSPSPSSPTA